MTQGRYLNPALRHLKIKIGDKSLGLNKIPNEKQTAVQSYPYTHHLEESLVYFKRLDITSPEIVYKKINFFFFLENSMI